MLNAINKTAINSVAEKIMDEISSKVKNLSTLNIIVVGKTSVGKSTLINAMFRGELAKTGVGRPTTKHIQKIVKKGVPLTIYDTRGLELGKEAQNEVKKEVLETIRQGYAAHDISQEIHCIWYCINTASHSIEPEEIQWLRELSIDNQSTRVPIIIVLTKAFSKQDTDAMKKELRKENLDVAQIVPVLAQDYKINEYTVKSHGLDTLLKVMITMLPETVIDTLQNVQIVSLDEKKRHAQIAVATASAAAMAAGISPIPFSDAAVLVPIQITMIGSITVCFGFELSKSIILGILSSTIGTSGTTVLGKTVVENLVKLIPVAGTLVGAAISGATAAAMTTALGEAYIGIMSLIFQGEMRIDDLGSKAGKDKLAELFMHNLKNSKKESFLARIFKKHG